MRYALLVGINSYLESPLEGCVHDVYEVRKRLETIGIPVEIATLTATRTEHTSVAHLVEHPKDWPTYDNMTNSMRAITSKVEAGDSVCVYYSGHGVRIAGTESNNYSGDVAITLLSGGSGQDIRYLRGCDLAYLVNKMVLKECHVTVVLDCCFSGGVSRFSEEGIKCLDFDLKIDMASPRLSEEASSGSMITPRDVSMLANWFVNPDNYTILAACGPHELAREIVFKNHSKRGALSYFLLRTIKLFDQVGDVNQTVYKQMSVRFRREFSQQNPVLYGRQTLDFFFPPTPEKTVLECTINVQYPGAKTYLQAGRAHGLRNGDIVAIYPPHHARSETSNETSTPTACIIDSRAFTSEIENFKNTPGVEALARSWMAVPRLQQSLFQYAIFLDVPFSEHAEWEEALKSWPSLDVRLDSAAGGSQFATVTLWALSDYEIRLRGGTTPNSEMVWAGFRSIDVLPAIHHLVSFQQIREMTNDSPSQGFRNTFDIKVTNRSATVLNIDQVICSDHGEPLTIQATNKGHLPIYLHAYSLDVSTREISNILRGTYEAIPPRDTRLGFSGTSKLKLTATIPPHLLQNGTRMCEDVVKIFVTAQPTNFGGFVKGRLGATSKSEKTDHHIPIDVSTDAETGNGEDWEVLTLNFRVILH